MYSSLEKHISINKQGCQVIILRWILAAQLTNSGELPRRFHPPDRKNAKWLVGLGFLIPRAHFSALSMRFGSRGPSDLCFSRPYVSDTSPKSIYREGLGGRRGGTWQTMIHLIYPPPPPIPPRCPCVVVNFPWDDCNTREKLEAMIMKIVGG